MICDDYEMLEKFIAKLNIVRLFQSLKKFDVWIIIKNISICKSIYKYIYILKI